jgi:hypothetical protein
MKWDIQRSINRFGRRKVVFTISTSLIAIAFLGALVGIFTGKFRPFAAEVSINAPSVPIVANHLVVPPAALDYRLSDGKKGSAFSNFIDLLTGSKPEGVIQLQGIKKSDDTEANLYQSGTVSIKDSNNNAVLSSPVTWSAHGFADNNKLRVTFDNQALLDSLDQQTNGFPLTFTIKPDDYLAVSVKNVTNLDQPLDFPQALVGDFKNDNVINEADYAVWSANFNKEVTAETTRFDLNKDGKIDEGDFALAFTDNFGKSGDSL